MLLLEKDVLLILILIPNVLYVWVSGQHFMYQYTPINFVARYFLMNCTQSQISAGNCFYTMSALYITKTLNWGYVFRTETVTCSRFETTHAVWASLPPVNLVLAMISVRWICVAKTDVGWHIWGSRYAMLANLIGEKCSYI